MQHFGNLGVNLIPKSIYIKGECGLKKANTDVYVYIYLYNIYIIYIIYVILCMYIIHIYIKELRNRTLLTS